MKRIVSLFVISIFVFSGCSSVRTYTYERDRVDQTLTGNRGVFHGTVPKDDQSTIKTRTMVGIDIESPFIPLKTEEKIVSTEFKIKKQKVVVGRSRKKPLKVITVEKRTVTIAPDKNKQLKTKTKREVVVVVKGEKTDNEPIILEDEEEFDFIK